MLKYAIKSSTPFEVYHGRAPNPAPKDSRSRKSTIRTHLKEVSNVRKNAWEKSKKKSKDMVKHNLSQNKPSIYFPGDKVLVKPGAARGSLSKLYAIKSGLIVSANHKSHRYKVKLNDGSFVRCNVNRLASRTRREDLDKRSDHVRHRIYVQCQCSNDDCARNGNATCPNQMSRSCCLRENRECEASHHVRTGLNIRDFVKCKDSITCFMDNIATFQHSNESGRSAHDNMVRNALQYDLVPIGDTPKDGNCMFHAVAASLRTIDARPIDHLQVRHSVIDYLRHNQILDNGLDLSDFVSNLSWDQYVDSLSYEWGDHICLIAISRIFDVGIAVISSNSPDIRYLEINETIGRNRIIYLGHEFELHYQHLLPIDQRAIPDSPPCAQYDSNPRDIITPTLSSASHNPACCNSDLSPRVMATAESASPHLGSNLIPHLAS